MFIYSRISWQTGLKGTIEPEVKGYYDSEFRWNEIPVFYLDLYQIGNYIGYFKEHPELGRWVTLDRDTDTLVVCKEGVTQKIPAEKIYRNGDLPILVWPIATEEGCFDVAVNEDDRTFTAVDIQDAIVYGIEVGITAGATGKETIDGLNKVDHAILYTRLLHGS